MKEYESLVFDAYTFDRARGIIELRYTLDDELIFVERLKMPRSGMRTQHLSPELLDRALFALHLMGGVSYYKTCCPRNIVIRSGKLTPSQAQFWKEIYENGLGEFFYRNNIDFRDKIVFPSKEEDIQPIPFRSIKDGVLLPMGGGKDSVVSLELLRAANMNMTLLRIGRHPLIETLANEARQSCIFIERFLPKELLECNTQGALNGHIPITGYISFVSILTALIYGFPNVVMSNERSANEGSALFHGKEINHQWSKSLAFEQMMQEYLRTFLTQDLLYFSLLRPLSEVRIAQIFARYPQYFHTVTSCNKNWRIQNTTGENVASDKNLWCGSCIKCAFVFLLLAGFVEKKTLVEMFGKNLFEDELLIGTYRNLLGIEGKRPFECVGNADEVRTAFLIARDRGEWNDSVIMQMFFREELPHMRDAQDLVRKTMGPTPDHGIPATFSTVIPSE